MVKLLIALLWLTALTFWIMIRNDRKEAEILKNLEADIFGSER